MVSPGLFRTSGTQLPLQLLIPSFLLYLGTWETILESLALFLFYFWFLLVCLFFCLFSCAQQRVLKEGSLCGEVCVYWLLQTRMSVIDLRRDVVGKYK